LTTCEIVLEAPLVKFEFALVNVATIEWVATEESGTWQGETIPLVKVTGVPTEPNVHPGSAVPPSA
jgi:hypothetical protein